MDFINLPQIIRSDEARKNMPSSLNENDIPMVVYALSQPIRSRILNYKKFVSQLDLDAFNNDNTAHNLLGNCVFVSTLRRAQRGEFLAAFAALPYSILSISRSIRSDDSAVGCPPIIRRLSHNQVIVISGCLQARESKLKQSNEPVARTCASLHAVVEAGSEFAMENPVDQGDLSQPELLIYP